MSGLSGHGWTHQGPLLAYTTICWPGRAPATRPAMVSTRSRPPCAAGGILVNSMVGPARVLEDRQPVNKTPRHSKGARVLPNALRTRAGLAEDFTAVPILRELIHSEPRCPIAHQPSKLQGRSPRRVSGLLRCLAEFNGRTPSPSSRISRACVPIVIARRFPDGSR